MGRLEAGMADIASGGWNRAAAYKWNRARLDHICCADGSSFKINFAGGREALHDF